LKRKETRINLDLPGNLPTVEQSLWELVITLEMLSEPGLTKPAIKRLTKKMRAQQVYQRIFKKYARYRKLELEMIKLARDYEELSSQS
jgi:hypothetical protein